MDFTKLKTLLLKGDPEFWPLLASLTRQAGDFEELFLLSSLRKKAHDRKLARQSAAKIRLAILGGYSLYPLHELIEHVCEMENLPVELWKGDYDNYISEVMEESSGLYAFAARNMREFWNRWHITLSQWMRDVVFAPLSKYLVRVAGPANVNHAVALAVAAVFFLIGVWHGVGWNYALFGLAQSLGVVTVHYYTFFLKKRLGREGFKAYNENRWIHAAAVTLTFCYYAATLFLFANTLPQMKQIFSVLRF